jgi:broad specificity phosphatase PhoE
VSVAHFITHPQVTIDPTKPVPDWPLSTIGLGRVRRMREMPWLRSVRSIFSSTERKAQDAANILAEWLKLSPVLIAELGENDRSATGYLPNDQFQQLADRFFAIPDQSVHGWERAIDAQRRIVLAAGRAIARALPGDIAIVSHGAVGALLLCHLKGVPISRAEDQPGEGGGHVFSFDAASRRLLSGWCRIEDK